MPEKVSRSSVVSMAHTGQIVDRITCSFLLHHEHAHASPVTVECKFTEFLKTTEQPYVRRLLAAPQGTKLEFNWLNDNVGYVVIENRTGKALQVNPTEEEKLINATKIIEVLVNGTRMGIVSPGKCQFWYPDTLDIVVRSLVDEPVEFNLYAMPK